MSHSDFMSRHANDIAAELELDAYDAETCPRGHHPSLIEQVAPAWVYCPLCAQVEALEKAGPPSPGNYIALVSHEEAERRERLRADLVD